MKAVLRSLALLLPVLTSAARADDLSNQLQYMRQNTQIVVTNARRLVEPTLTTDELRIAQKIDYRVYATGSIGAFAAYEDQRRVIVIQAGAALWSMELANAFIAEEQLGIAGCTMDYLAYVANGTIDNSQRYVNGLPLRPVAYFAKYAEISAGPCSQFQPFQFTSRPDLAVYRAKLVDASMAFLYLHELGHHVLGHTAGLALSTNANLPGGSDDHLAMKRTQEDAADRWAIRSALRAHFNPAVALPIFFLIAATGGNSIESERRMDHPLGMRRVLTLYDEVYFYYMKHQTEVPNSGYLEELRQRRAVAQAALDSALAN